MFQSESASPGVQVVAVIDPVMPLGYMVLLLRYNSVHERFHNTNVVSVKVA